MNSVAPRFLLALVGLILLPILAFAQDGGVDPDFNISFTKADVASRINALAIQPDGKIVAGGSFRAIGGGGRNRIARLNPDGTLDTTFDPIEGCNDEVSELSVDSQGRVLIAGSFTSVNGVPRPGFARLLASGLPDLSFHPPEGFSGTTLDALGRILVQRKFRFPFDGDKPLARLNPDGSLDQTFQSGTVPDAAVTGFAIDGSGNIYIAGQFTSINGIARARLARLLPDGTLDTTFTTGALFQDRVIFAIRIDPAGRLLVSSSLPSSLLRLNPDGQVNPTFQFPINSSIQPLGIAIDSAGRIVTSNSSRVEDTFRFVTRFLSDGTPDSAFSPPNGFFVESGNTIALDAQGRILVGGDFAAFYPGSGIRGLLVRFNDIGTIDTAFRQVDDGTGSVTAITRDSAGRRIVAGNFASAGVSQRFGLARLNADGSADPSFDVRLGSIYGGVSVEKILEDNQGRLLILGSFDSVNGTNLKRLARLNQNGTLDFTFNIGTGPDTFAFAMNDIENDAQGRILVGGNFTSFNGISRPGLVRLNEDGSVDQTFTPQAISPPSARRLLRETDGKLVIAGDFSSINGIPRPGIARLNADGSLDASFDPGTGPSGVEFPGIFQFLPDGSGGIYVSGTFTVFNGAPRKRIVRLNADGSVNAAFSPAAALDSFNLAGIAFDPTGKLLINAGDRLIRLTPNGDIDGTFFQAVVAFPTNGSIQAVSADGSDGILVGGGFQSYDGLPRIGLARLKLNGCPDNVSPTGAQFGPTGGTGALTFIGQGTGCPQTVVSLVPWIAIDSGGIGSGGAPVQYTVAANNGPRRAGTILVNRRAFQVEQSTACDYSISSPFSQFTAAGGDGSFELTTTGGCVWEAQSNRAWLTILGPTTGQGNATIGFRISTNLGPARNAIVAIGDKQFSVTQSTGCTFAISPSSGSLPTEGGTGSFSLTTSNSCGWQAQSDQPWLQISPSFGTGNATIGFSASPNVAGPRTAIISIGDQRFQVTEAGCSYSVSPTELTINATGGDVSFTVTTSSNCPFNSITNVGWITAIGSNSYTGPGPIRFRVSPNSGRIRVGFISIAGQGITVTQAARNAATPGQFRASNGFVYIRNSNDTGFADTEFFYGQAGDIPLSGDWDGDGSDSVGIYRNGVFYLRNTNTGGFADIQFPFGQPGDIPVAGDWNGDGVDTIGVIRGNRILLRNSNSAGPADIDFNYGLDTDTFIVGDWNGDGIDTIGAFRTTNGFVYLRNANTTGNADVQFFYGQAGDRPVAGDWDGDGVDTIGVVRGNRWLLRNTNTSGFAHIDFNYGDPNDIPIVGDWNGTP